MEDELVNSLLLKEGLQMKLLFDILIFLGIFSVFDALRRINNNILNQTEELKKLRDELIKKTN